MGKCSVCGKKIEYNNYKVIDGVIYCPDCVPKKEPCATLEEVIKVNEAAAKERQQIEEEVAKAEEEAKEQFEQTMIGHGETEETAKAITDTIDEAVKVDSKVLDRLEEVQSYQYKPKKKRGKKKE